MSTTLHILADCQNVVGLCLALQYMRTPPTQYFIESSGWTTYMETHPNPSFFLWKKTITNNIMNALDNIIEQNIRQPFSRIMESHWARLGSYSTSSYAQRPWLLEAPDLPKHSRHRKPPTCVAHTNSQFTRLWTIDDHIRYHRDWDRVSMWNVNVLIPYWLSWST